MAIGGRDPVAVDLNGGCINCTFADGFEQAISYEPDGDLVELSDNRITAIAADGQFSQSQTLIPGPAVVLRTEAWAGDGTLAVSGRNYVSIYHGQRRRLLGSGSEPSWGPTSRRLAIVRDGWITVISLTGNASGHRLVRGSDPAFSPDGHEIAFISHTDRVEVISSAGGQPHMVGAIRGRAVAWQTVPNAASSGCPAAPATSVTLASSGATTLDSVTAPDAPGSRTPNPGEISLFVCNPAQGQDRVLDRLDPEAYDADSGYLALTAVALTGRYAVITIDVGDKYAASSDSAKEFDVSDGKPIRSSTICQQICTVDGLALTTDGDFAALTAGEVYSNDCPSDTNSTGASECRPFELEAYDRTRTQLLDSSNVVSSAPGGPNSGAVISDLQADGQTLSWLHGSTPESTTLP